jgi:hypothetical protein
LNRIADRSAGRRASGLSLIAHAAGRVLFKGRLEALRGK